MVQGTQLAKNRQKHANVFPLWPLNASQAIQHQQAELRGCVGSLKLARPQNHSAGSKQYLSRRLFVKIVFFINSFVVFQCILNITPKRYIKIDLKYFKKRFVKLQCGLFMRIQGDQSVLYDFFFVQHQPGKTQVKLLGSSPSLIVKIRVLD